MTVPPDRPDDRSDGGDAELDFDPYRFGAPDHPVPPEYAPPGYRPPAAAPGTQPGGYTPPPYRAAPPGPQGYAGPPPGTYGPPNQYGQYGQYPPGQYGPPPGYPPYPYGPQARRPGKAIASLALGIGAIVLSVLSFLDVVLIVPALVFGVLALGEARRSPTREGRNMAVAGISCAVVGAVLAVVLTVWYVHLSNECKQYKSSSSQYRTCIQDHV